MAENDDVIVIHSQRSLPAKVRAIVPKSRLDSRFHEKVGLLWQAYQTYDSSLANFRAPGFLRKRIDFGVISTSSSSLMNSRARSSPISR